MLSYPSHTSRFILRTYDIKSSRVPLSRGRILPSLSLSFPLTSIVDRGLDQQATKRQDFVSRGIMARLSVINGSPMANEPFDILFPFRGSFHHCNCFAFVLHSLRLPKVM